MASNWLIYQILLEAGLPPNVIQFIPGDAESVTNVVLAHKDFASLHFTGSTAVFRSLYGKIATGISEGKYRSYPRIVGETGGKNFHLIHPSADIRNAALQTIRGAFEYQGQKCSACSRAYIPSSMWNEFKKILIHETESLQVGSPLDFKNFIGPVIHKTSYEKLASIITAAKTDPTLELVVGGAHSSEEGYFIHPTIYVTTDPTHKLLSTELFGPILVLYIYPDSPSSPTSSADTTNTEFTTLCTTLAQSSDYALTASIFARDRSAITSAESILRHAAGNFYINTKCTGAVVGQQPFGGGRASGTNDKAGSRALLGRFVSGRALKEEFVALGLGDGIGYVSNEV